MCTDLLSTCKPFQCTIQISFFWTFLFLRGHVSWAVDSMEAQGRALRSHECSWDFWLCLRGYLNAFISFLCLWDGSEEMPPEEGGVCMAGTSHTLSMIAMNMWQQREERFQGEGFLVLSGAKAQGEGETAKTEFRSEALEAPRLLMKLATWLLAAFS